MKQIQNSTWNGKHGPLLIAEIGGNHEGDFDYARRLTELAIEADVDYIKFQIYTGDTLVNPIENPIRNKHFKKFELEEKQHIALAQMCKDAGIGYMASIWNPAFAPWVDAYSEIYKIGSGDFPAFPVIEEFSKYKKPLLISSGLSSMEEVGDVVRFIQDLDPIYQDPNYLALLQCTSMYPIPYSDANLSVLAKFKNTFNIPVGYSDHTEGAYALEIAVALGAEILEFHFTDVREGKEFRDHKVSLTKCEVQGLIKKIKDIEDLKGDGVKTCREVEEHHHLSFRRACYLNRNMKAGEVVTSEDLAYLRPNHGIDARDYRELIGKILKQDIGRYVKIDWSYFN
jgi:N-acetylneuraminate synthase/N,N'-diacetyllegionaminate synthase